MLIVGLLLIALVCLALGLVLPSSAWLIASLIATAGAGYLLWKARVLLRAPAATMDHGARQSEAAMADAPTGVFEAIRDDAAYGDAAYGDAAYDDAAYPQPTVPTGYRTQPIVAPSSVGQSASDHDVWVIDGRPRYHLPGCAIIQGQDAEPIPFEQATEDGFMPCSLCEPHLARTQH